MHKRSLVRVIVGTTLILLITLILFTSVGQADFLYQTVPTMPPPTKSPTQAPINTSTSVPRPSATLALPTALPPTQTAEVISSATHQAIATNTPLTAPSATPIKASSTTPPLTSTSPSILPVIATPGLTATSAIVPLAATGLNLGQVGLIIAGFVIAALIFLGVLRWTRRKTTDHPG